MYNTRRFLGRMAGLLFCLTAVCFAATGALAVPITNYITVQPIDVCTPISCAPINNLLQASGRGLQTAISNPLTTQIGDIDSSTGSNLTRKILNQIGVDVTFLPVAKYQNATSASYFNINDVQFSLNTNGTLNTNQLTSPLFKALSDQPTISTTTLAGGTVATPANGAPVSTNPATINMFFVNNLIPLQPTLGPGGTLYGLGWLNNNGLAIDTAALTNRPDTIAHELVHNLGLDHYNLGLTTCDSTCAANLMTTGTQRTSPTTTTSALTMLGNGLGTGTADQLSTVQGTALTDPSSNLNPIPLVNTRITPGDSAPFHVSFDGAGRPGEYLSKLILTAPPDTGFFFEDGSFSSERSVTSSVTCTVLPCPDSTGNQLEIDFNPNTFTFNAENHDFLDFNIALCKNQESDSGFRCISNGDAASRPDLVLDGGTLTYQFETDQPVGGAIAEIYVTNGDLIQDTTVADLISNSQNQDPSMFAGLVNPDGTPYDGTDYTFAGPPGNLACSFPDQGCSLVLADAPNEDPPLPAPEPSSLLILLAGLGLTLLQQQSRWRCPAA
jgi:hypothetical protein